MANHEPNGLPANLLLPALALAAVAAGLLDNFARPDLFGYLSFGRRLWTEGAFPWTDTFAYVPTRVPWIFNQWLFSALAYPLWQQAGAWALQALRYGLGLSAALFLYRAARLRGARPWSASLSLFLSAWFFWYAFPAVKGQMFTFFFYALVLWLCEATDKDERYARLLWLPLVSALWTNLHSASVAGMGLVGLYAAGRLISRKRFVPFALAALGMAAAGLANPYGWQLFANLAAHAGSPDPELWSFAPLLVVLKTFSRAPLVEAWLGLAALALVFLPELVRRDRIGLLVLAATAAGGFLQVRHLPFFPMALAVFLPVHLEALAGRQGPLVPSRARRGLAGLLVAAYALYGGYLTMDRAVDVLSAGSPLALRTPANEPPRGVDEFAYPVEAVQFLKARHAKGRILSERVWAPYIIWNLYPDFQVGMDTRGPSAFPGEVRRAYHNLFMGYPGWRDFLYRWPPDVLALATGSQVARALAADPRWMVVHQDPCCTLLFKAP